MLKVLGDCGLALEARLSRLFAWLGGLLRLVVRPGARVLRRPWRGAAGLSTVILTRTQLVYLLVVVTGAVGVMLRRVDSALRQMRLESGTSGTAREFPVSLADLGGSILMRHAPETSAAITRSWRDYDVEVAGRTVLADAHDVAREVVLLDAVFAVLYTLLLAVVMVALFRACAARPADAPAPAAMRLRYRRMLERTGGALALLLFAELAEGFQVWYHIVEGHRLAHLGPIALGPATTLLRIILDVAVLVPILIVAVAVLVDTEALRRALATTRAVGLAVVALGVLLFVGIGAAQVDDVIRAWTPSTAAFALAAAIGLAIIVTGVSRDLSGPRAEGLAPDTGRPSQPLLLAGGLALAGLGLLLWWLGLGWGIAVAGGLLVLVWLLGLLLAGFTTAGPPPAAVPSAVVPPAPSAAAPAVVTVRGWGDRLARGLGGLVLAMLVWVVARAVALDLFARRPVPLGVVGLPLLMAVLAAAVGAWVVVTAAADAQAHTGAMPKWPLRRRLWFWMTLFLGACLVALSFDGLAVRGAEFGGTVAIVLGGFGFVIGVACLLAGLVRTYAGGYALPPAVRVLRVQRFPVVAFLLIWVLVVSSMDQGGFHDIRRGRSDGAAGLAPTLGAAWANWAVAHAGTNAAHPVVLVAAQGGGIRAAVWTALVMECLFGPGPVRDADDVCAPAESARIPTPVFLASGASGGSLGIAAWSARRADLFQDGTGAATPQRIEDALSFDFVAPDAARMFTADLPHTMLVWDRPDRAEMLERSWQGAWPVTGTTDVIGTAGRGLSRGLRTLWTVTHGGTDWATPIVALNGVSVEDGCRFLASAVDFTLPRNIPADLGTLAVTPTSADDAPDDAACRGPADPLDALPSTSELIDYLCPGEDVPLSTAAHISARFPYISPTGRIARTGCADAPGSVRKSSVSFDADGGIFDNSGAGTVVDSWRALSPLVAAQERQDESCFPPIFIQIDNSPPASTVSTAADPRPGEMLAPIGATLGQVGSRESYARARAAAAFSRPVSSSGLTVRRGDGGRLELWFRVSLYGQPGPQPPLGWTLAPQTVSDMRAQLRLPQNAAQLHDIRNLLTPGNLQCSS